MKNQLKSADKDFENVVAVVGDGHIPGLADLLNKEEIECKTIRLKDIRKKEIVKDGNTASFTIEQKYS